MKVCREAFSFKFAEVLSLGLLVAAFSYGMLVAVCVLSRSLSYLLLPGNSCLFLINVSSVSVYNKLFFN